MKTPGFIKTREEKIDELKFTCQQFEHEKTGAQLIYLPADDDNKVFAIAFNTHPQDSTGVAHILEHSVLNGSRKYPVKEPFLNLMQGSLNTFLNAMTGADTTMYPVASQNDKDFSNLVDVYLDAVFHPNIDQDSLTFRQEGWHLALDEQDRPYFNGVVYNEMKGAMSSPDTVLAEKANQLLFDNIYRHCSGGMPENIVDLTYEDFLAFYHRYYHPSNAHIFLYGKMDLEAIVGQIDGYLSAYDKSQAAARVPLSTPRSEPQYAKLTYPSEDPSKYAFMQFVYGDNRDEEQNAALQILTDALFNFESSPVKRALVDQGYCVDVSANTIDEWSNTLVQLSFKGVQEDRPEGLEKKVLTAIEEASREDLEDVLRAAFNKMSFEEREADTNSLPKGVYYSMTTLFYWDEKDFNFNLLRYEALFQKLDEMIRQGKLQALIKPSLVDNTYRASLLLTADPHLAKQEAEAEAARAKALWEHMSEAEQTENRQLNAALAERQNTPDTPEQLATLPKLSPEDIKQGKQFQDVVVKDLHGHKLLHYEADTAGIRYFSLIFPVPELTQDANFILALLARFLGSVDTAQHTFLDLNNKILSEVGDLSFDLESYGGQAYLLASLKALPEQVEPGLNLLFEILTESSFANETRLKNLLQMEKSRLQMQILNGGSYYALLETFARQDVDSQMKHETQAIGYYKYLVHLIDHPELLAEVAQALRELLAGIASQEKLILSFTGSARDAEEFAESVTAKLDRLAPETLPNYRFVLSGFQHDTACNRAYKMPSQVQYVAMGGRYQEPGQPYDGRNYVFNQILSSEYLWNEIRVKGGAYGCFVRMPRSGLFGIASFRDPNCRRSLEVYRKVPEAFRQMDRDDLFTFIIGTIATFDHPHSVSTEGSLAMSRYLQGITAEDLAREREQILNTDSADLKDFADLAEKALQENCYTVLGNAHVIDQEADLFEDIQSIK